jgi:DNA-binding transcriptional regulator YiaG
MLQAENVTTGKIPLTTERRHRVTQEQTVRDVPEIKLALLTEQELAERWRMSIRTLQGWRQRKTGPNFIKIRGQAVRYPMDDVLAYEAQWQ